MINWKPVSTTKGRLKVLVLTDKGKKAISYVKLEKIFNKRGSFEHEYAKFKIGEYFRKKGYWVTFEYKIGEGKTVDVVAEKDGKRIAIEIETGKSDSIYNIRKDLEAGFDHIISVGINDKIKEKVKKYLMSIDKNKRNKIQIVTINNFINN